MTKCILPKNIVKHNLEYSDQHPITLNTIIDKENALPIKSLSHNACTQAHTNSPVHVFARQDKYIENKLAFLNSSIPTSFTGKVIVFPLAFIYLL